MRKWKTSRFGKRWRSDQIESNGGSCSSSDGLAEQDSLGPLHSHLGPSDSYHTAHTSNDTHRYHVSIDEEIFNRGPSTPSTYDGPVSSLDVVTVGGAHSIVKFDSSIAVSPITLPSAYNTQWAPHNSAIETSKDKIDEENYSAWWFLTSQSFSFDRFKHPKIEKEADATTHDNDNAVSPVTIDDGIELNSQIAVTPRAQSVINESRRNSFPSILRNLSEQAYPPQSTAAKSKIGAYILKEQQVRKKWLKNVDAATIVLNQHDRSDVSSQATSNTPYHFMSSNQSSSDHKYTSEDNIEWTPQDSSYGAACQMFGWIPKRLRKIAEGIMLVIILGLLIFGIIKTGMYMKASGSGEEASYFSDDDHYVANDRDSEDHSQRTESSNDHDNH